VDQAVKAQAISLRRSGLFDQDFDFFYHFIDLEPEVAQGYIVPENGYKQKVIHDFGEIDVLAFAFVEQQRKLLFTNDGSHGAHRSEIPGGQCRQRVDIVANLTVIEVDDDISGHVDEKHGLYAQRHQIGGQGFFQTVQLFLIQDIRQCPFLLDKSALSRVTGHRGNSRTGEVRVLSSRFTVTVAVLLPVERMKCNSALVATAGSIIRK